VGGTGREDVQVVPAAELAEVCVEDETRPVTLPPGLPRGDDQDAHHPDARPPVAVVVATRDRADLLEGALEALLAVLRPVDELLVVDSGSLGAETRELCARLNVRYLRVGVPGTSHARNAGLTATVSPLVAFTDDDCRPAEGWTAALAGAFADPAIGLVTGRVLPDRDVPAPVSLELSTEARGFTSPIGHGANCCFRREALLAVGGFDETLGPGARGRAAEDVEAFRRVLSSGWRGWYEPSAVVVHLQWRTRGASVRRAYAYGVGQASSGGTFRTAVWRDALVPAARDARAGYPTGAASGLARAAGAVRGLARRR
jgi:cellulose synthase/poly-beta-1,6-N-acetylglucosamine synthase-like glycosyltransferase